MFDLEKFIDWLAEQRNIAQEYMNEAAAFSDEELEWQTRKETITDVLAEIASGKFHRL